jgi:hypothetical protein
MEDLNRRSAMALGLTACFVTAGEFNVKKADKEFTVKKGEYYTCGNGKTDHATNVSKEVGIHRITILVPA